MENQGIFNLSIDDQAKAHLLETARWTKFLAILWYIFLGLLLVIGVVNVLEINNSLEGAAYQVSYALGGMLAYAGMILIYFFPALYLYKFSRIIKPAILSGNQPGLNSAFRYQKMFFRYMGVLTIITICLLLIMFIFVFLERWV